MKRINSFGTGHPWLFSLAATLLFILIALAASVLGRLWPDSSDGSWVVGAAVRLVFIALLVLLLRGLGWLASAGFTSLGRRQTWLISLPLLIYAIAASAYAMTRSFIFRPAQPIPAGLMALFIFAAACLEETVFRGLILHNLVRAWNGQAAGALRAVLVSSFFFAAMHLVNILGGQPILDAATQSLMAFFLGFFLGCLVLAGLSIYPAIFFHGMLNFAGFLNQSSYRGEWDAMSWLLLAALLVPLAAAGYLMLRSSPVQAPVPDAV